MRKDQIIQAIILGLSTIIGAFALYSVLQLPDNIEWFQIAGLLYYVIILSIAYICVLILIGIIARFLKKELSKPILKAATWSALLLIFACKAGAFVGFQKANETKQQMAREWKSQEEQSSTKYIILLDSLNTVIQKDPTNYNALVERGKMKRYQGEYEASITDYKKALEIEPNDFEANLEMGYSLGSLGKKEEQDSFYRVAAKLNPDSYFAQKHPEYLKE